MKKLSASFTLCLAALVSSGAWAAPGEFWEISTKMEMAGMPFAMPANTSKVCVAKGNERDPKYASDKECVVTDVKNSGNKTSWKVRCDRKGEVMNGTGEMTGTADNSQGTIRLTGTSEGQKIDMTQSYSSKRLGGACDPDELANKAKSQICEGGNTLVEKIYLGHTLLDEKVCPGKKQPLCDAARAEAPRDAKVFFAISDTEKTNKLAKTCGINMEAANKAVCKTLNGDNVATLTRACPAESKAFRENERRKACEGRSYTAKEDLSNCLAGKATGDSASDDSTKQDPASPKNKGAAVTPPAPATPPNPTEALIDGAKKLKGLFGL